MKRDAPGGTTDDFLRRWSRRKRRARNGPAPEPAPTAARERSQPVESRVLTDADMPPVESLEADASVAEFFSPGVSEALRKAALRRVFRSARFNVLDGLEDYDEDFRSFEALGDVVTADLRHRLEQAARRGEAQAEASEPEAIAGEQPESAQQDRAERVVRAERRVAGFAEPDASEPEGAAEGKGGRRAGAAPEPGSGGEGRRRG
jgi:hypothetical protein